MLNENQKRAVEHMDGALLCLAGPGSGKTTVLVNRIVHLIKNGIDSGSILVITFTKDAAMEMKSRFLSLCPDDTTNDVSFGTFHSIFYQMLRSLHKYKGYQLITGIKKLEIIKECLYLSGFRDINRELLEETEKLISYFYNTGNIQTEGCIQAGFSTEKFMCFIDKLAKRKENARLLDFDDMLIKTKEELNRNRGFLDYWQNRYKYFLVDELQDINGVQFQILQLLIKNHPCGNENIFGVGDDDQAIYGFRGASPGFMLDFPNIFQNTKTIILDTNYRSSSTIVNCSQQLIENNKERFEKDFVSGSGIEGKIEILKFETSTKQAEYISETLSKEQRSGDVVKTAILFRNKKLATTLMPNLKTKGIKVFSYENIDAPKSEISIDIKAYFSILQDIKTKGKVKTKDLIRILNRPERGLDRGGITGIETDLETWQEYYPVMSYSHYKIGEFINQMEMLKEFSPYGIINFIYKGLGYEEYVLDKNKLNRKDTENILKEYEEIARVSSSISGFLKCFKDESLQKLKPKDEAVFLYTFHGSKGLEFDRVFIIDANEGITPAKTANATDLIEEERRMFYVAMTRAKSRLCICYVEKRGEDKMYPSRFIDELGV